MDFDLLGISALNIGVPEQLHNPPDLNGYDYLTTKLKFEYWSESTYFM